MQGDHRRIKKNDFFKSDKFFFLILTLFLLFFNFNALKVRITDLNYWDESQYIIFGKLLMQGDLPVFSWSPFTAFFFGLLYLPFHGTANWLPLVATLGRFIIYLLLLLSAYLVGREIKFIPSKFAIFGMALVYPVMVPMLKFQSDALFAVNSAFALWQLLRFINAEQEKNLWLASLFVGFSALTRNDGLILFLVFLFFVLFLLKTPNINLKRKLAASIMPFAALLLGYILLYGLTTGSFNMGTKERTWGAFRQGQYFIYGDQADCAANQLRCAMDEVERLYGNSEENNHSIFNAIRNNPQAYLARLKKSLTQIPKMLLQAYGSRTAFSLLFFSLFGIFELLKREEKNLLFLLIGWALYLPAYLLTFFRTGYFYLPYYLFFTLSLIGIFSLLQLFQDRKGRMNISYLLLGLTVLGTLAGLTIIYFTSILLLFSLWMGHCGTSPRPNSSFLIPALFILMAGILWHGGFEPASLTAKKTPLPEEEAITLIFNEFAAGSSVTAGAPGAVASAQMEFVPITDFGGQDNAQALHDALLAADIQAIYIDHHLSSLNKNIWQLIEPEIGNFYERLYSGDEGSIQVLKIIH